MSNKIKNKRALLDYLLEDNPPPQPKNMADFAPVYKQKDASLDQVIDRYIIRYEKESIPNIQNYENEMFGEGIHYSKILEYVLSEAEDDEEGGLDLGAEDDAGLETPPEDLGADETEEPDSSTSKDSGQQVVAQTPQINLQQFAKSIARLVNNYESLLNPKNIILNRVEAYMVANYDQRISKELMDMLEQNYSLRSGTQEEQEKEDKNIYPTPYAAGALSSEGG
jgi:hypothetical protein